MQAIILISPYINLHFTLIYFEDKSVNYLDELVEHI